MLNRICGSTASQKLFFAVFCLVTAAFIPVDRADANFGAGIVHADIVSEAPSTRVPRVVDGKVWAIAQWGNLVVVGGEFSQVRVAGGSVIERSNIFAFWRSSGAIDRRFAPVISGTVRAIAVDPEGRGVFVGGQFGRINGESRRGLGLLSRDGVRVLGWAGRPNGTVFDLAVRGDQLYVGGKFSKLTGAARSVFGTVNVSDGRASSESSIVFADPRYSQFRGVLEIRRFEISPDGSRMVVLGNFQTVDGATRDQVVVLDVGSSPDRVTNWSTTFFDQPCNGSTSIWPYFVRDVSISPDGSYFVVATVGGRQPNNPYHPCDMAARLELNNSPNQSPTWIQWSGGDSVLSVEATGNAVYIGGHYRWLDNLGGNNGPTPGSIARGTLAAVDPLSGAVFDWNPGRLPRGQGVLVMEASPDGLWIGHDTGFVNNTYSPRLTHFALPESSDINRAQNRPASQSSIGFEGLASRAVDGNTSGVYSNGSVTHTLFETQPWWQVDLGSRTDMGLINIFNRTDCCSERLSNVHVFASDTDMTGRSLSSLLNDPAIDKAFISGPVNNVAEIRDIGSGRYLRIQLENANVLSLAEVQVFE